ncbi:MAG: efflux RND transporter periplasmic adaptor subunit [Dehalococcoidales bacterium]|nr:efflux RND transporter periplasmic adaptor subunit [Dehalococcoidales bacterium]
MRTRLFRFGLLLGLTLTLLVIVACGSNAAPAPTQNPGAARTNASSGNQTPAQTPRGGASPGQAQATPKPAAAVHISASGSLSFVDDRKLTFRTSGNVGQVNVNELDKVTKGQVLARLDTTSLQQALMTAELGVKTAEFAQKSAQMDFQTAGYSVNTTETDLKLYQNNVKSAAIDLDTAADSFRKISYPYSYSTFVYDVPQAVIYISDARRQLDVVSKGMQIGLTSEQYGSLSQDLQKALDNLAKSQELLARGQGVDIFASGQLAVKDFWTLRAAQQALDKAQVTLENAQNTANKYALTAASAKTALSKALIAVEKSNNDLEIAKNNLNIARTNLDNAIITAPFDGIVANVNIKVGDFLSSGTYASTVAVEIIDSSRMELDVAVNELDITKVKVGQKAAISVDAVPNKKFEGLISSIESMSGTQNGVVSYGVNVTFDVPKDSVLRAGMAATADITVS